MEKVALLKCTSYNVDKIEAKLREGFELLGGENFLKQLLPKNCKVLLKPNLLSVENPGSPVITHFSVFEAVIRIVKEYTDDISFGDSPGFGDTKKAADKAGLMDIANKYGVKFADFNEFVHVKLDNSLLCKSWDVAKAPYEADVLITLPKLKTHGMAFYTGAIKNQFGCVPGTRKASWHTRMPEAENFSKMLLDLNTLVGTSFAILDGIISMEGNGPKSGNPIKTDILIMGKSISAVDSTAVRLIGYDNPIEVPVLDEVYRSKWGAVLPEEIEIFGESLEDMKPERFELCRTGGNFHFFNPTVFKFISNMAAPIPALISEDKCISCKRCQEVCPEGLKVITMIKKNGKLQPQWEYKECIRCFCCQELCPVGAIETKHTTLGKILGFNKR